MHKGVTGRKALMEVIAKQMQAASIPFVAANGGRLSRSMPISNLDMPQVTVQSIISMQSLVVDFPSKHVYHYLQLQDLCSASVFKCVSHLCKICRDLAHVQKH